MVEEFGLTEVKLKDYRPKYKKLELMVNRVGLYMTRKEIFEMAKEIGIIDYHKAVERYGDLYVISVRNYDTTRTTSIILRKFEVS